MEFIIKKLFTKEDPFHIHKLLGIFCMFNYIYRYGLLVTTGSMNFHRERDIWTIIPHALLSCSSLLFHISYVRNKVSPMIYPEFRIHSILFALRSICCCILSWFDIHYMFKMTVCFITMFGADITTKYYDKIEQHGRTTFNMPYPTNVSDDTKKIIRKFYANSQISATLLMIGNSDTAFSPMFAIQMAAFMMTMVRKNLMSSTHFHIMYAFTLWINIIVIVQLPIHLLLTILMLKTLYTNIVFPYKINKYIAWSCIFSLFHLQSYYNFIEYTHDLGIFESIIRCVLFFFYSKNWLKNIYKLYSF